MKVKYSKSFMKAVQKLSGKMRQSVTDVIQEVVDAEGIEGITDCKKLVGYKFMYQHTHWELSCIFCISCAYRK